MAYPPNTPHTRRTLPRPLPRRLSRPLSRTASRTAAARLAVAAGLLAISAGGCKSLYYNTWEKLGYEKRDLLVSSVGDARDEQVQAKEQFKTTLERFKEVTNFQGGDLEAKYNKLSSEYDDCVDQADAVTKKVADVEEVAGDMFAEWKSELAQYNSDELRRSSQQSLYDTKERYDQLISAMKSSQSKMKPVLLAFHDQVLFLKHHLNAEAIGSLQETAVQIDQQVSQLIDEMEKSINEADQFVKDLK